MSHIRTIKRVFLGLLFAGILFLGANQLLVAMVALATPTADSCFVEAAGDNTTDYSSADGSAVQNAINAASGGDTLKIAGTCANSGSSPVANINKNLTLEGGYDNGDWTASPDPVANPTILDAANSGRVVNITNNATVTTVTLRNLTLRNGNAGSNHGGGINTDPNTTLYLINSRIEDNSATAGGDGGAGGGLFHQGIVSVQDTTFLGNTSNAGGAIYSNTGLTITNSSFISNTATTNRGGGIYYSSSVELLVENSTFSGNSAGGDGGGIWTSGSASNQIRFSTFSGNSTGGTGGGIDGSGATTLYATILADNTGGDCFDATDGGYNLIKDGSCLTAGTSQSGAPLLLPLTDAGGATQTHPLSVNSPARDAIPYGVNGCLLDITSDQRGISRANGPGCDIGAYEYANTPPVGGDDNSYSIVNTLPLTVNPPGVLLNDSDSDGDTLYAAGATGLTTGTLTLDIAGGFTYTPAANFVGDAVFTYTVADGALTPVAHWPFDEGSGTSSIDASGNQHTATLNNDATYQTASISGLDFANHYALTLDGNDVVTVGDSPLINLNDYNERTVSVWFRADDITINSRKQIIWQEGAAGNGLNIYLFDSTLYAGAWSGSSSWSGTWLTTTQISNNTWHHIVLVLNSSSTSGATPASLFLYLDGQLLKTGAAAQLHAHSGDISIGNLDNDTKFHDGDVSGDGGHGLAGQIDDLRVMNQATTANEVAIMRQVWPGASDTAVVTIDVQPTNCWVETTGDNQVDYVSNDGSIVQTAIGAATAGDTLKIAGTCTNAGSEPVATITKMVNLAGGYDPADWLSTPDPVAHPTVLDGGGNGQVVYINSTVNLANLTISGGDTTDDGAGIYNDGGTLSLTGVTVEENTVQNNQGGGIYNRGTLTITQSTIQHNKLIGGSDFLDGAGIYNNDTLLIEQTLIANNWGDPNQTSFGGAIFTNNGGLTLRQVTVMSNTASTGGGLYISGGMLTVEQTAVISNTADSYGGGIYIASLDSAPATIANSTISGNQADWPGKGAAIYAREDIELSHTTIVGNQGDSSNGSGIYVGSSGIIISQSIVAHNSPINCNGNVVSTGYNLESGDSCGINQATDQVNIDPLLDPLADNGGNTWTHALLSRSPALNTIPGGSCTTATDQRGVARPQFGDCDSGAYENSISYPLLAVDDTYTVTEDNSLVIPALGVLTNDHTGGGVPIYATLNNAPNNGLVSLSVNGAFTYTPTLNYNGADSFIYKLSTILSTVAYWPFEVVSGGSTPDASDEGLNHVGYLNGPTLTNTVPELSFANSQALSFNGGNDAVNVNDATDINTGETTQRSISLWFRAVDVSVNTHKQILWEEGGGSSGFNIYLRWTVKVVPH